MNKPMNKPFVLFSRFFAALVVIAFAASALADVVYVPFVKVDVNSAGSGTLSGYNSMNFANDTLTNTVSIYPDISVKVDRVSTTKNRDRGVSKGDALTNDFIFEQTTNEPIIVTINGLIVGKEYSLKIYSQDITANNGTHGTWNITQGETTTQIGVQPNTTGNSSYKSTDPATYLAYTFTASANTAVLTGLATDRFVFFNGVELNEAYDPASGYTKFDVNSNNGGVNRIMSPRSTELYVGEGTATTATATAPSGITMTVTSEAVLNSRTRAKTNASVDMNLYNDFLFSSAKKPFTITLDNLSADTIYRMTVHSVDPDSDQCAGRWTMTNNDGDVLFVKSHSLTFNNPSTWAFSQSFKPGTTSVSMIAELNGKVYTMFNGLELQTISQDTANYTWGAGRAAWLADGKWLKKDGTTGTPVAGDICYVTSTDTTGMNTNYWLETTTATFPATLVMGTGSRLIMKTDATANDLIFDGGYLHHGEQNKTYTLSGNLLVASNSTIDIDDGGSRTLKINAVMTGSGNLTINGNGVSNAVVELNNVNEANYHGKFILTKTNLKLTGTNACVGTGDLDIPSTSQLTLNGPNAGLHYVSKLTGSGPISVTALSRFDLASSEAQDYSGTISIAANQTLHVGYTKPSADCASDVNLPNATISLASKANLGLIHENSSTKASSITIGTLNSSESTAVVRSSGSVNTNKNVYGTVTVGKGDFAGTIIGQLSLVKNTDGTLTLSGTNTYAGRTDIQEGTIVLTGNGSLGTGAVTIGENGTLEFNVPEGSTKKTTISSAITGSGKITKTGEGVLQLYAAAEGLIDAASFVVSSGRLDMKEFFKGTLEIGNGAEFSPGNSVGTLNVNGKFKADAFSTLIFEQDASGMDSLSASLFDIDPNAEIQLDITALIPGATYDVIVNTSTDGFTQEQGSETFWTNLFEDGLPYYLNLSVVDNHIVRMQIDANAVPEPSTWALLVLGVVVLFFRKRS